MSRAVTSLGARVPVVLAVSAVGAVLAACGGGDSESDPVQTEKPTEVVLTQDELIAEADGICAEVNAAIGTIDSAEAADATEQAAQRADIYDGLADRLEELGNPSDGSPPTAVIAAARALGASDADEEDLSNFQEAADDYGLSTCAEDPEAPSGTPSVSDGTDTGSSSGSTSGTTPVPVPAPAPAPAPVPDDGGGAAPVNPGSGGGVAPSGGISPG
ncbi:MAG: hypothetical protein ACO3CR_06320 [Solirubrobacterales bacterium]